MSSLVSFICQSFIITHVLTFLSFLLHSKVRIFATFFANKRLNTSNPALSHPQHQQWLGQPWSNQSHHNHRRIIPQTHEDDEIAGNSKVDEITCSAYITGWLGSRDEAIGGAQEQKKLLNSHELLLSLCGACYVAAGGMDLPKCLRYLFALLLLLLSISLGKNWSFLWKS